MIGKICIKLMGREAGHLCTIVDQLNDNFVIIDGNVKRRKCNLMHLEQTNKSLDIKKGASTQEVIEAMKKAKLKILKRKEKKKTGERPRKIRKKKEVKKER